MGASHRQLPAVSRKAEALAFITAYLTRTGHSPTMPEIAASLGVSVTRAKALVHRLAEDRAIERSPGAQRAISVPGLFERLVKDRLRAEGWLVDEDVRPGFTAQTFPKGHLPLVAILDHIPDPDIGGGGDGHDGSGRKHGTRTPAGGAPGPRKTAAEGEASRAA